MPSPRTRRKDGRRRDPSALKSSIHRELREVAVRNGPGPRPRSSTSARARQRFLAAPFVALALKASRGEGAVLCGSSSELRTQMPLYAPERKIGATYA